MDTTIGILKKRTYDYRKNTFNQDGSITINHNQNKNQIFSQSELESLTTEELQFLGLYLMTMSYNTNKNAIIENDHVEYWSYINAKIALSSRAENWIKEHHPLYSYIDFEMINKFTHEDLDKMFDGDKQNRKTILSKTMYHSFFPAVWAGYAYLEGVCKRMCKKDIDIYGTLNKTKRINGKRRTKGERINNLGLLIEMSKEHLKKNTVTVLNTFLQYHPTSDIYKWRCDALHGSEDNDTTIIVLYCLISIICLDFELIK